MNRIISKLNEALIVVPPEMLSVIRCIPDMESQRIQEIRLRRGRCLTVSVFDKEYYVSRDGKLINNETNAYRVTDNDIDTVFKRSFQNSIHSYQREISQGYVTISGGSRVGFCGTAVTDAQKGYCVENVKNISSVNIRIAREVHGAADELMQRVFSNGVKGLIIIAPPSGGKTTVIRDLCRQLGTLTTISLIDERNEISSTVSGYAQNDTGPLTDIFNSYTKYDGIMTAVKVMAPKLLVCDEIGSKDDLKALEYAVNSGVKLIATTHASSYEDAKKRSVVAHLIKNHVFDYAAVLGTGSLCGKLTRLVCINND